MEPSPAHSWRRFGRTAALRVCCQVDRVKRGLRYAAIGTLNLSDVRSGIEYNWDSFLPDDADIFRGLFPAELKVVRQFVRPSDHVVGCGTGRDMLPLLDMGCRVTGVDPAASALTIARRVTDGRASIIHGFFEDVELEGHFDTIIFSWYCYAYIPGSDGRINVLQKAADHLAPGGRILISYYSRQDPPISRLSWIARAVGTLTGSDWKLEAGDRLNPCEDSNGLFAYEHVFGPGEIEAEVARAGLRVEHVSLGQNDSIAVTHQRAHTSALPNDRPRPTA